MLTTVFDLVAVPPHGESWTLGTYMDREYAVEIARHLNRETPEIYHDVRKRLVNLTEEEPYVSAGPIAQTESTHTNRARCHH